jgi:hypothetical protein
MHWVLAQWPFPFREFLFEPHLPASCGAFTLRG